MPDITTLIEKQSQSALSKCVDLLNDEVAPGVDKQVLSAVRTAGVTVVSASPVGRQDAAELLGAIGAALAWQLRLGDADAALLFEQGARRAGEICSQRVSRTTPMS